MLFRGDYSFRGIHAEKVNELTAEFDEHKNKLFNRNLDVYLLAPLVGFLYGRKAELDSTGKTTNILYDAMSREVSTLWFNYRLIILLDKENEPDIEKRIDKAFRQYSTEQATNDENLYEAYVRGGVEILHEKLCSNVSSSDSYLVNLYEFIEGFEKKYGHASEEILDLVKLAGN